MRQSESEVDKLISGIEGKLELLLEGSNVRFMDLPKKDHDSISPLSDEAKLHLIKNGQDWAIIISSMHPREHLVEFRSLFWENRLPYVFFEAIDVNSLGVEERREVEERRFWSRRTLQRMSSMEHSNHPVALYPEVVPFKRVMDDILPK